MVIPKARAAGCPLRNACAAIGCCGRDRAFRSASGGVCGTGHGCRKDGTPRFILIDTGRASTGERGAALVRDELAKRGITRLDLVILTHLDADHAEGTFTLLGVNRSAAKTKDSGGEGIRGPPVAISRILLPADTSEIHNAPYGNANQKRQAAAGEDCPAVRRARPVPCNLRNRQKMVAVEVSSMRGGRSGCPLAYTRRRV
jgi:hypothetical protein